MRFEPNDLRFPAHYESHPFNLRTDNPKTHAEQTDRLAKQTADHVRKRRTTFLLNRIYKQPKADAAECAAMRHAFEKRLPYLSPKHKIPKSATVDSLLGSKVESFHGVSYGKVKVSKEDAATFEELQRELAAIDGNIATRQLYQAMHGDNDMNVHFSKHGVSVTQMFADGSKSIYINTRMSILDPVNGTTIPISVVLGHEIEHANLPLTLSHSLLAEKDKDFSNLEEVRVIDGYEAAMLNGLNRSQRSTHISHILPVDDEGMPGIPYSVNGSELHLRPGDKLSGKMIEANAKSVTLEMPDGKRVQLDTPLLMLMNFGLDHVEHLGFESPLSILEKCQQQYHISKAVSRQLSSDSLSGSASELLPRLMEESFMAHPEMTEQLHKWQDAVKHGDTLTISINPKNIINLHRHSNAADPIGTMLAKQKDVRYKNMRNRAIAVAALSGGVVVVGGTAYAISENSKAKSALRAQLQQQYQS